jgi:hypothetical protein
MEINDNQPDIIVGSMIPQFRQIHNIITSLTWTHHLEILKRTSSLEEKVFYLLLA